MKGKYSRPGKRSFGSKSACLMLALILVIGCAIGGTLAWLTAKTGPVENTFVAGQIGTLELEENADQLPNTEGHQFIVVPGVDITKDPKVTYTPTTEAGTVPVDAYVFVKLDGIDQDKWTPNNIGVGSYLIINDGKEVMSFAIANGWTPVPDAADVYYKTVSGTTGLTDDPIIAGNTITVSHEITEATVEDVAAAANNLTFTAYAIQQQGFANVKAAWTEVSK